MLLDAANLASLEFLENFLGALHDHLDFPVPWDI